MIEKKEKRKQSYYKNALESAFFYSNNTENSDISNFNFEFKSGVTPPQKEHLNAFENDLYDKEFRRSHNIFQTQLATDTTQINKQTLH